MVLPSGPAPTHASRPRCGGNVEDIFKVVLDGPRLPPDSPEPSYIHTKNLTTLQRPKCPINSVTCSPAGAHAPEAATMAEDAHPPSRPERHSPRLTGL